MDIGFVLNYQHVTLIDTNPGGEPDWAWVGPGIETISSEKSETTSEKYYYDGGGHSSKSITGLAKEYTIEGDRLVGDKFQDWAASLEESTGSALETIMRRIGPDGATIDRDVTVHEITASDPTGTANENANFSCKVACNGDPRLVSEAAGTKLPESVSLDAVEVGVGEDVRLVPEVTPSEASGWCLYAISETGRDIASVDADGNVRGLKQGDTLLTIKCAAKPSVSVQVPVSVRGADASAAE